MHNDCTNRVHQLAAVRTVVVVVEALADGPVHGQVVLGRADRVVIAARERKGREGEGGGKHIALLVESGEEKICTQTVLV